MTVTCIVDFELVAVIEEFNCKEAVDNRADGGNLNFSLKSIKSLFTVKIVKLW